MKTSEMSLFALQLNLSDQWYLAPGKRLNLKSAPVTAEALEARMRDLGLLTTYVVHETQAKSDHPPFLAVELPGALKRKRVAVATGGALLVVGGIAWAFLGTSQTHMLAGVVLVSGGAVCMAIDQEVRVIVKRLDENL